MINSTEQKNQPSLKPLPKGLVGIYGLLAIIMFIIPEFLAELAITMIRLKSRNELPKNNRIWEIQPELLLATLKFRDLRLLAMELKIHGYARENKDVLSKRVLNALERKRLKTSEGTTV